MSGFFSRYCDLEALLFGLFPRGIVTNIYNMLMSSSPGKMPQLLQRLDVQQQSAGAVEGKGTSMRILFLTTPFANKQD